MSSTIIKYIKTSNRVAVVVVVAVVVSGVAPALDGGDDDDGSDATGDGLVVEPSE